MIAYSVCSFSWHVNQSQIQSVVKQQELRTRKFYEHQKLPCRLMEGLFVLAVAEVIALASACNHAYGVIKQAIQNGKEIASVSDKIGVVLDSEEKLKHMVDKDKNSIYNKFLGKSASDFEAFQKLEELKENRDNLRSMCRLYGRPGSWDRFIQFESEARAARAEARKQAIKDHNERMEMLGYAAAALVFVGVLGVLGYFALKYKGII